MIEKKVDSEWKKKAEEEKEKLEAVKEEVEKELEEGPLPPPTFISFLASLDLEARLALGEIKHPVTGEAKTDIASAQYVIDTLALLQEKTKGNLTHEEERVLQNLLTELRFRFVQAKKP